MSESTNKKTPMLLRRCELYTIGIVCALPLEADAVKALFDYKVEREDQVEPVKGDKNSYSFGTIDRFHVVLAQCGDAGKIESTRVGEDMARTFPNIELCLLVGICGIIPQVLKREALLGDVVLSTQLKQYDLGKQYPGGFKAKKTLESTLGRHVPMLRNYFNKLRTIDEARDLRNRLMRHLLTLTEHEDMVDFDYPGYGLDHLYRPSYVHEHRDQSCTQCKRHEYCDDAVESNCAELDCAEGQLLIRDRVTNMQKLSDEHQNATGESRKKLAAALQNAIAPQIFLGTVACADRVMKSGDDRDRIAAKFDAIAFEMEGAGLWDTFPTVVVKGACDYADSHKNKMWQRYAAASAAACAKAFLQLSNLPGNVDYSAEQETTPVAADKPNPMQPGSAAGSGIQFNNTGTFTATKMYIGGTYISHRDMNFS